MIRTVEKLETLNRRLSDHYGKTEDKPNFRIVWSEDQREIRLTGYTDEGLQLIHPEYRELPKYKQWIHNKYLIERLTVVPSINAKELTTPLSYEPIWVFEDKQGNALQPIWTASKFIIEQLLHSMEHAALRPKYIDPRDDPEKKEQELAQLEADLFGNETSVGDALAYRDAIVVPKNLVKEI